MHICLVHNNDAIVLSGAQVILIARFTGDIEPVRTRIDGGFLYYVNHLRCCTSAFRHISKNRYHETRDTLSKPGFMVPERYVL